MTEQFNNDPAVKETIIDFFELIQAQVIPALKNLINRQRQTTCPFSKSPWSFSKHLKEIGTFLNEPTIGESNLPGLSLDWISSTTLFLDNNPLSISTHLKSYHLLSLKFNKHLEVYANKIYY
jgi:hypothetical protein